jgi:hypothetical protein
MRQSIGHVSSWRGKAGRLAAALTLSVVSAAAWAGGSAGAPSGSSGCVEGPTTLGGAAGHAWCGPAKATVHVAGKTYHFKQGICQKTEGFTKGSKVLSVNIGTQTLPPDAPKASYFGVLIDKAKGGKYKDQAVGWQVPGKGFAALTNKVAVSANLKKGSFSGNASVRINGKVKDIGVAKGSWTC